MILLSLYMKLALGFLIAGFIVHFIGFVAPFWNYYSRGAFFTTASHIGLWTYCGVNSRGTTCSTYSANSAGIHAARAFEVLAVIGFIVLLVLLILYLTRANVTMLIFGIIASFVIVALIIIGILCWVYTSTAYQHGLHFAFAFCIIGAILTFIGGILLIRERMTITVISSSSTTTGGVTSKRTVTHTRVTVTR